MSAPTPTRRRRLLVVDDHVDMTRILADHLGDAGYEVVVSNSGGDAIERVRSEPVDLVITDLRMAGTDGFDVLDCVLKVSPDVPVLIMTAFGKVESSRIRGC